MYILPNSSQVGKSKRRSSRSPNRISVASFCDWVIMTSSLNKYLGTGKATVLIGWELSYKNHPWWINWGLTFPGGSVGKKNPPAKCRKCKRLWFNPRVRRRKWQPTPVFSPGKSHGQRSLAGYSPWGQKRIECNLGTKKQHGSITSHFEKITGNPLESNPRLVYTPLTCGKH